MPSSPSRPAELERLIARPFAHRGLHGGGRIENSRAAFTAAIQAGFGIELDVQASADGVAMVFHDHALDRLTEAGGPLAALSAAQLTAIRLRGSDEAIPSLEEVLALIGGRTPLLIEAKTTGREAATISRATQAALRSYVGPVAIMSFNPGVARWFAREEPGRLRGLVVTEAGQPRRSRLRGRLAAWWARPDFLAYDIRDLPSSFAAGQRRRGRPLLTWTCRSPADRERAAAHADQIIFEQGDPGEGG